MKTAVEIDMSLSSVRFPSTDMSTYDSTKHNLGPLMFKGSDTWTGSDIFAGPAPIQVGRPMETSLAKPGGFPHAVKLTSTKWLIALADISTAATLRNFMFYEYDLLLGTMTYKGAISFTFPTAATIRGIRLIRVLHTTGTVQVAGTAVTGSGTDWLTRRVNAGSRIGFGSSDPSQITTWYDIAPASAISSNTALTLSSTAGTIAAGTPYVIEDYSLLIVATCATVTDGGLRIIKGINPNSTCLSTTATATVISLATTVDNIRACYWLKDAATVTNTTGGGVGIEAVTSDNLTCYAYVIDGAATSAKVFKYNVKKALTLTAGVDTTSFVLATGAATTVGNISQVHNARIGTLNHGAGNGVSCLYFTTASRLYRCPLTYITSGSTGFLADAMLEVPPGSTTTLPATGAMSNLEIFDSLDRIAWFSSGATAFRHYVTQYRTDSSQLNHIWLSDDKVQHQSSSDVTSYPYPSTNSTVISSWAEGGMCFIARHGTTVALNQIYSIPVGCHYGYQLSAPYNVYITPALSTPGAVKYYNLYVNKAQQLGGDVLGISPEAYKVYYRTTGINDNSGSWNIVNNFDLSGIAVSSQIQFKFEFKIFSATCVPARILGLAVVYEAQDDIPNDLRWNMDDSSDTDGTVGFIQATTFSILPTVIQIDYYRSDTNANVLTQLSSSSANGVFEYHNGSSWISGIGPNIIGTRRRFRPTSGLPSGVAVYPKLTVVA